MDTEAYKSLMSMNPESYGIPEKTYNYLKEEKFIVLADTEKVKITYTGERFLKNYRRVEYFMSDHPFTSAAIIATIGGIISGLIGLLK